MTKASGLETSRVSTTEEIKMLDISSPEVVEVLIRSDKKVIWVNVDGFCRLRISKISQLEVNYT